MSNVTKPTSKGKFDGAVDYLCSDEARFLVMRGDYSEADIIQASVSQDVIDAEGAEDFALWLTTRLRKGLKAIGKVEQREWQTREHLRTNLREMEKIIQGALK